jgi:hypothetical protein
VPAHHGPIKAGGMTAARFEICPHGKASFRGHPPSLDRVRAVRRVVEKSKTVAAVREDQVLDPTIHLISWRPRTTAG